MSDTKDFDTAIKRLNKDLKELESVSKHLNEVQKFAGQTKELGKKFDTHLEYSAELIESSTDKLDSFIDENGENIEALTKSHQELQSRVKDMEDKVTVLNTKTEAIAKELTLKIQQLEKELKRSNQEYFNQQVENVVKSRNVIIYFLVPILILLIILVAKAFI
jgi:chromosome segregation ATPase